MRKTFELLLVGGRTVEWDGDDGVSASQSYANAHPGAQVFAFRERRRGMYPMLTTIAEPGDKV